MFRCTRGQASVELVALLPLLAVLAAGVWQAAVAGHAMWSAGAAARSASRALAVGGDAGGAARRVLPARLRDGARVRERDGVEVAVTVPIRALGSGRRLAAYTATARFAAQR